MEWNEPGGFRMQISQMIEFSWIHDKNPTSYFERTQNIKMAYLSFSFGSSFELGLFAKQCLCCLQLWGTMVAHHSETQSSLTSSWKHWADMQINQLELGIVKWDELPSIEKPMTGGSSFCFSFHGTID
jgi:hypothetical protein